MRLRAAAIVLLTTLACVSPLPPGAPSAGSVERSLAVSGASRAATFEAHVRHVERFPICVNADGQEVITRVTIDRGWRDGVRAGMRFFVGDVRSGAWMTIEDAAERTSRGTLERRGEAFPTPWIGSSASTRFRHDVC